MFNDFFFHQLNRLLVRLFRLRGVVRLAISVAEVRPTAGVVGVQRDGFLKGRSRLVIVPLIIAKGA